MGAAAETRHDLWLKRINTWIGILGGSFASVVGAYNFFPSAPGDIAAVVREQGGAPVSRAHVELLTSQNVLLGTSQTDRQGRYVKKDLEPGSYVLKVSRVAFEPEVATVSVTSKKTTDVELVLISRSRAQASTRLKLRALPRLLAMRFAPHSKRRVHPGLKISVNPKSKTQNQVSSGEVVLRIIPTAFLVYPPSMLSIPSGSVSKCCPVSKHSSSDKTRFSLRLN